MKRFRTQASRERGNSIAAERCAKLLTLARQIYSSEPALAKRYVFLARQLAMRHRIPLGAKDFCKACGLVWIPGRTVKVRTSARTARVIYACLACGATRSFGYLRERTLRRKKKSPARKPV